jgi:hypothetical protein
MSCYLEFCIRMPIRICPEKVFLGHTVVLDVSDPLAKASGN